MKDIQHIQWESATVVIPRQIVVESIDFDTQTKSFSLCHHTHGLSSHLHRERRRPERLLVYMCMLSMCIYNQETIKDIPGSRPW